MNIIIADDQDLVRDAIAALVSQQEPESKIVKHEDLYGVLETIRESEIKFDIALLDLNMPGMKGIEGVKQLMQQAPDLPIMIMSGLATRPEVDAAMDIGVRGFIPKTMPGRALVNSLKLVISGEKYVHSSIFEKQDPSNPAAGKVDVTARELDTLQQLFLGSSNKEIARNLNIQETTVKLHLRSLCEKFDAKNRTDLIIKAIKQGYGEI